MDKNNEKILQLIATNFPMVKDFKITVKPIKNSRNVAISLACLNLIAWFSSPFVGFYFNTFPRPTMVDEKSYEAIFNRKPRHLVKV